MQVAYFLKLGLLFNIRVRVGYELAIIISYSTSLSGIIFFIKNANKISRILPDFICRNNRFQLVFNFEQTRTVTIFGEHDNGSYTVNAKLNIGALELYYPMIQFLITLIR